MSAAARSSNAVKRGGTLRFARSIGPTTLDPANTIIAGDIYTLDKILEPLYVTNPAGQLVPWLATGYEVSTDHRTFTFSLRPGVKFSNGKPLVAEDVVFSINRTRKDAAGRSLSRLCHHRHRRQEHRQRRVPVVAALGAVPF